MDDTFLTPIELLDHPELAVLRILRTSLDVAGIVLQATHLDSGECPERNRSEPEAFAVALHYQIEALEAMLEEYVESIRRQEECRGRESSGKDIGI